MQSARLIAFDYMNRKAHTLRRWRACDSAFLLLHRVPFPTVAKLASPCDVRPAATAEEEEECGKVTAIM